MDTHPARIPPELVCFFVVFCSGEKIRLQGSRACARLTCSRAIPPRRKPGAVGESSRCRSLETGQSRPEVGGLALIGAPPPLLAQRRQQIAAAIMHRVVALCAKGYKIPALPRQIRVHPCRVAVVHSRRRAVLAIAQALLAQVAIAPQDACAQSRPSLVRVNAGRHAGYHLRGDRQQKKSRSQQTHSRVAYRLRLSKHWPLDMSIMISLLQSRQNTGMLTPSVSLRIFASRRLRWHTGQTRYPALTVNILPREH